MLMRKNNLNKKQKLSAATFVCMLLLAIQSNGQVKPPEPDTVKLVKYGNLIPKNEVKLLYNTVPSNLTATSR